VTRATTTSSLRSIPAPATLTAATSTGAVATSTPTAQLSAEVVRLVRASHGFRAQMHAAKPDGIEWAGSMLLLQLCKDGPQRSSALAAAVCVDPSTVSRQIGDLVDLGLVERRADPHDGRATLLAATAAGEMRYQQLHERRDRAFALMLADWSDPDVSALVDLLRRLNDTLIDSRTSLLEAITQDAISQGAISQGSMHPPIDERTLDVQEKA
jgi:DNA-binding MarR family transcriptional regulator